MGEKIYPLWSNHTKDFKEQKLWMDLGELLNSSFSFDHFMADKQGDVGKIADKIKAKQKAIENYYKGNSASALRKYILDRKNPKKYDWRVCRILCSLVFPHYNSTPASVSLLRTAKVCSISGKHDETLEMRRVISCLALEGLIIMVDSEHDMNPPAVRLSKQFLDSFGGGSLLFSDVSAHKIRTMRAQREAFKNPKKKKKHEIVQYVESLPNHKPSDLCDIMKNYGVVGQDRAKRDLSLLAYRHVQRLRRIFLDGVKADELPEKQNALLIGGTGTGKTMITSILFKEVLGLPSAYIDITSYSESGYVGDDIMTIPTRLIMDAKGDVERAQMGVIVIDELDKISQGNSNKQSMVSRSGVQRSLLKLLEPTTMQVNSDFSPSFKVKKTEFSNHNVLNVGLGCFEGLELITNATKNEPAMGFHSNVNSDDPYSNNTNNTNDTADTADAFNKYGFSRELFGRLHNIIHLDPLTHEEMRNILVKNVISKYKSEMNMSDLKLEVADDVVEAIIEQAIRRGTGARGLTGVLYDPRRYN